MIVRLLIVLGVLGLRLPAHEIRPAMLDLREHAEGNFSVVWKLPVPGGPPLVGDEVHDAPTTGAAAGASASFGEGEFISLPCGCSISRSQLPRGAPPIHPQLPAHAKTVFFPRVPTEQALPGARIKRWSIDTGTAGLVGSTITVHGLQATMLDVLVRIEFRGGHTLTQLLRPSAPSFVVPPPEGAGAPVATYLVLGVEHILLGIDHLLFVLCLLLLVHGFAALVKTITAFTLAHSITLGMAVLGYVQVPIAPVEAVIALSILFLASEVVRTWSGRPSLTARAPWLVAFAFGLLHGFGFAGALGEVGLPADDIPLALLLFNLGIEAGQVVFVAAVLGLLALLRNFTTALPDLVKRVPVYGIGATAAYWCIARTLAIG